MIRKKLIQLIFITLSIVANSATAQIDQIVKLANKVSISNETESWIKVSVPFNIIAHPRIAELKNSRPSTVEEVFNPEFLESLKVKIYVCFSNEFKKKALRNSKLMDSQFYQYYSAEVKFEALKIERTTKYAHFLFPSSIAERDGFGGNYINPVGYAVEIMVEGVPVEISNSIMFDKYRDETTLLKFKQQAEQKSTVNEGVLLPAHHVFQSYFQSGAYLRPVISE
jgi:hypothetical protein